MSGAKVLLVGWDAADWKVILPLADRGEMPHLARFLEDGVMGDITTLQPVLSPMLWNSIATGKHADLHGILGFTELDPESGRVRPVTSTSRRAKALWNIFTQQGLRSNVINWFGGHPAEPIHGVCVSDAFCRPIQTPTGEPALLAGAVHPPELTGTLSELQVHPDELDEQLACLFVPRAVEINQEEDHRLAVVAKLQAEAFGVHACATHVLEHHPWNFMAIYYPTIDHFSHAFMDFHPPKLDWVDQRLFDLYHDVLNSAYRLHDLMLGSLLAMIDPQTTVILCSDHGFHSDHLRREMIPAVPAGPAAQHRDLGIFAMRGPGIKKDERIYGVNLLDIAPTVLTLFGLPVGADMPGRVLLEAFDDPPRVERIPSWEQVTGEAGMHRGNTAMPSSDAQALLDQFVALGYIEKPQANQEEAARSCLRERNWNLAQVYLHTGRPHLALPILEELCQQVGERGEFLLAMSSCQRMLGLDEQARATALAATEIAPDSPAALVALAGIDLSEDRLDAALARLGQAGELEPNSPQLPLNLATVYTRMRRWEDAEREISRAIAIDPHYPEAREMLARVYLRQQRWEEAAAAALEAVGMRHDMPASHLYLGIALLKMGRLERAMQAFQTCLSFHPPLRAAHIWLARTCMRIPGKQMQALHQRELARQARLQFAQYRDRLAAIRNEAIERAERKQREAGQPAKVPCDNRSLEFLLVSGLPRSGTSLMMQMLQAGGLDIMTDGERKPDQDNPHGYLEWEAIKQVRNNPEILYQAEGKAIKVISMLLPALPNRHRYKVIFMDRPIDEVMASQTKMIEHRREQAPQLDSERMKKRMERHRQMILRGLERSKKKFDVLVVDYPSLVTSPREWIPKILEFVGAGKLPNAEAMLAAVDPALHRNRAA